jgi:hypothetical protein
VRVGILLTRGNQLHDCIISQRGEVWDHNTSLNPLHFIEVHVTTKERERSCIFVRSVNLISDHGVSVFSIFGCPISDISNVYLLVGNTRRLIVLLTMIYTPKSSTRRITILIIIKCEEKKKKKKIKKQKNKKKKKKKSCEI